MQALKLGDLRLHVRAIVRDSDGIFVGSQSLRRLELDGRREIGLIVKDAAIARKVQSLFEADWANCGGKAESDKESNRRQGQRQRQKDKEKDKDKDKAEKAS